MRFTKWNDLPDFLHTNEVKPYYDALYSKRFSLVMKRLFDIVFGLIGLVVLLIPMVIIGITIQCSSDGGVFFLQPRISQYGKMFKIIKFRTMVVDAPLIGSGVTTKNDSRITPVGKFLRKYRLDELPQIINIIKGDMSFVGTRPESTKYVRYYKNDMFATLLLPSGVTSMASIQYKDEAYVLDSVCKMGWGIDDAYMKFVLPEKMKINLEYIKNFSLMNDIKILFSTLGIFFRSK